MFSSELDLVNVSLSMMVEEFKKDDNMFQYIREPKGLFGIPDLIIFNGDIIAIEYKLKNWKQAIKQAYRYKSFSSESYVVLDKYYIERASKNIDMFKKYNIGLAAVDNNSIEFYYRPQSMEPYDIRLSQKAMEIFEGL